MGASPARQTERQEASREMKSCEPHSSSSPLVTTKLGSSLGTAIVPQPRCEPINAGLIRTIYLSRVSQLSVPHCILILTKLIADAAYQGPRFRNTLAEIVPCLEVEIVKRSDHAEGFVVLPKRWIVERTIAWLNRCRGLGKD
jgi:transposase